MGNSVVGKLYHVFNPRHPGSTIKTQRQYALMAQALEIGEAGEVIQHSSKVRIAPVWNNTELSLHLLLQTLTLAYRLLDVTQLGHFGDGWLCVSFGTSSQFPLTVSSVTLSNNLTSQTTNCPELGVVTTPYLFLNTHFGTADCFKASGTHFVRASNLLDCNKALTLNTPPQPQYLTIHSALILCGSKSPIA